MSLWDHLNWADIQNQSKIHCDDNVIFIFHHKVKVEFTFKWLAKVYR